ncbi:MAG: hypothetical protein AAF386_07680 [Pseudomonadota bacterium]
MTRSIILHIGAPKCGSTYLQRVMLRNQAWLRDKGVNYPHRGQGHPGNADQIDRIGPAWIDANLGGFETLILSHENLFSCAARGRRLANLCYAQDISLKIIAFLRPFQDWLAADYSQALRQHLIDPETQAKPPAFATFVRRRRAKIRPTAFLENWQSLVPDHPITVAHHTDVRRVFCGLCTPLVQADWAVPKWQTNTSLPLVQSIRLEHELARGAAPSIELERRTLASVDTGAAPFAAQINAVFKSEAQAAKTTFGVSL